MKKTKGLERGKDMENHWKRVKTRGKG